MQSEAQQDFSSPSAPTAKKTFQPNLNVSRSRPTFVKPKASVAKQRRNERQQLLHLMEEIIDVQEILYSFSTPNLQSKVLQDFLYGLEGAPKLSLADVENLKTFYRLTRFFKRPTTITEFNLNIPSEEYLMASRNFKLLMDGSQEKADGGKLSYAEGKALIRRVLDCGYFSRIRFKNATVKQEKETKEAELLVQTSRADTQGNVLDFENIAKMLETTIEENVCDTFKI